MRRVLVRASLPVILGLLLTGSAVAGPELAPEPHQRAVAREVGEMLSKEHFAARPVDDNVARLWLDGIIELLDSQRSVFLASDVAQFEARATEMDDDLRKKAPELDLAFDVHARYVKRLHEAIDAARFLTVEPQTFDDPKEFVDVDRDDDPWPKDAAERLEIWRGFIRAQLLALELGGETPEKAREIVAGRLDRRLKYADDRDAGDVTEIVLGALASIYDPHSVYFKPSTSDDFDIRMRDELEGIGAELRQIDAYTHIIRLIPGGPAERTGVVKPGDVIVGVAQGPGEIVDVVDMRLDRVVELIRGPKDSVVRLSIRPAGADATETRIVSITRDKVVLERASAKASIEEVPRPGGGSTKVAVIDVPSFYLENWDRREDSNIRSTSNDVRRQLERLRGEGIEAVVIDLRENGGGSLFEAIALTGLFIDTGPVVQVRDRSRPRQSIPDAEPGVTWAGPLVVLTDQYSASASEIFAGAIQDHGRGIVVGSKQTHGKGSVQVLADLGDTLARAGEPQYAPKAGVLKLTTQMFYRINGESTQGRGIEPDVLIPGPGDGIAMLESDLDHALPWEKVGAARYTPLRLDVDLDAIRAASAARVASQPIFGWLSEDVARYKAEEEDDLLSLHRESRKKEMAQDKARSKARYQALGLPVPDDEADTDTDDIARAIEAANRDAEAGNGEITTYAEALERAVLEEALAVTADYAASWKAPRELIAADLGAPKVEPGLSENPIRDGMGGPGK